MLTTMTRTGCGSHGPILKATFAPAVPTLTGLVSRGDPPALPCMPRGVHVALRKATPARWHHEGDEQPRFPPLPRTVTRLPVTPGQILPPHRCGTGQAIPVRCSPGTAAGPTPQRSASRPGGQSHRPHHPPTPQGTLPTDGGPSALAAQMTSVATERDPAMMRARARSRRYLESESGCLRCKRRGCFVCIFLCGGRVTWTVSPPHA